MIDGQEWLTGVQVQQILGVTRQRVYQLGHGFRQGRKYHIKPRLTARTVEGKQHRWEYLAADVYAAKARRTARAQTAPVATTEGVA